MAKLQRKQTVKTVAQNNTSVTRKYSDGTEEVLKNGSLADPSIKHSLPNSGGVVGMAKGVTKNMGDFESLRVDVWFSVPCPEPSEAKELFEEVESIVDEVLESTVIEYLEE